MTTVVTERNEVSIPPAIAAEFDIHPGTRLEWAKAEDGLIVIKPLPNRGKLARELMGSGRRWLRAGANPMEDLIREREKDDVLDQVDERQ